MLGDLSDVAAKYNYSSVDDMFNNLSPAARDDIMKMFDKPLGSFDLDKVDDFKVKNQVFDAKKTYKEILKNPDDIKQIAKNTGLDTEDVKKVKDYLFKEKHLMPDGTYRQFDASEEIADAWKRLTNGKATDEDLLLFNHELTELRFVEEGFSVDAAHILSSVDYNWSSVSKIDDFAKKCSEIYGKDFYFGAGTSNEAIDAIVKKLDDLDGQVDDLIEGNRGTSFTWKLRGEDITLNNVKMQEVSYVKRSSTSLQTLRNEFNTTTRKAFLENLGKNTEYLKSAGFSETDILKIQNGRVPDGWQVHHKLPLDDSGTNSFDNLVLIQNEPYHKVITNYQNNIAKQMKIGDVQTVQWPMPDGKIYPEKH